MSIDKRNRIPASELTDYTGWSQPPANGKGDVVEAVKKRQRDDIDPNQDVSTPPESISHSQDAAIVEDISLEEALSESVMSADALEKIANEAHEEGFNAGHEEGVNTGYQEGFSKGHEEGAAQGHQEGYEAGLLQAKAEAKALSDQVLSQQVNQLTQLMQRLIEPMLARESQVEGLMLELLKQTTQAVLMHEAKTTPDVLTQIVSEAIKSIPVNAKNVVLYLNPEDIAVIENTLPIKKDWQVEADMTIQAGGCRIETSQSQVDNTIESRLSQVFEQLLERQALVSHEPVIDADAPKSEAGLSAFLNDVHTSDNWDEQQALQDMIHSGDSVEKRLVENQSPIENQLSAESHLVENQSPEEQLLQAGNLSPEASLQPIDQAASPEPFEPQNPITPPSTDDDV